MAAWWLTLTKEVSFRGRMRKSYSVDAKDEAAACQIAAETLGITPGEVASCRRLPYPAEPRLNYKGDSAPSFCFQPDKCAGHSSCPRNYACSE